MAQSIEKSEAVEVLNPSGIGPVVILCEHASHDIPVRYDGLGLSAEARISHAAWDPGALGVSRVVSQVLDAPVVASTVSRLVYDCNRPPEADSAMPARSEMYDIPGNRGLSDSARAERVATVYQPYCKAVSQVLEQREASGLPTAIVTIHSFTPVYHGKPRSVELGILHDEDRRLADAMLDRAARLPERVIKRNEPYGPADGVTHSLKLHAISRDLPNVMIEFRNDLVQSAEQEQLMARDILTLLHPALTHLGLVQMGSAHG